MKILNLVFLALLTFTTVNTFAGNSSDESVLNYKEAHFTLAEPNFSESLEFVLKSDLRTTGSFLVFDSKGKTVYKIEEFNITKGANTYTFDLSILETGNYFIELNVDNKIILDQIIKE